MMSQFAQEIVEQNKQMMSQFAREIVEQNKQTWWKEGRQEGLREGAMETLLRQMHRRFGPVPDWVHARLARANLEILKAWTEKILEAGSIDDLFQ